MATQHRIPPPPRPQQHGEFRPVIEPPIRDMVPFPGQGSIDEWEPFPSEVGKDPLPPEVVMLAEKAARADQRVKKLLDGKRHVSIGTSRLDVRGKQEPGSLLFVFFDYDTGIGRTSDLSGRTVLKVGSTEKQTLRGGK